MQGTEIVEINGIRWNPLGSVPPVVGEYRAVLEPDTAKPTSRRWWNGSTWSEPYHTDWDAQTIANCRATPSDFLPYWAPNSEVQLTEKQSSISQLLHRLMDEGQAAAILEMLDAPANPSFAQTAALYASQGLEVTEPAGAGWSGRTMVCAPHEGVPYCLNVHNEQDMPPERYAAKVGGAIADRAQIIELYHPLIRQVYDYCVGLDVGDIWVLVGGGSSHTCYFGNKTGYLSILHLDLKQVRRKRTRQKCLDFTGKRRYTLAVNWERNNHLFQDKLSIQGLRLRLCDVNPY